MTLRVVLADDAALVRMAIGTVLRQHGFDVVAEVGDPEALLSAVETHRPHAVVVDVRMPPTFQCEGLEAALDIRARWPEVGVLVLSQYIESRYLEMLLAGPARGVGYLLKERVGGVAEFADALRRVAAGGYAVDPEIVALILGRSHPRDHPLQRLSEREREVLALMAEGCSNQAIAERLVLTPRTVECHVRNIFMRLDLPPTPDHHRRVVAVLAHLKGLRINTDVTTARARPASTV